MSGAPRLLEFWLRLLVTLLGTEPLDADNDNPIVFWLFELIVVDDMVADVFSGVDDCNGVDVVKLLICCWCCCCCCCVLLTLLFFNDCVIVPLWLLLTILFKLLDVEEESRLFNVLLLGMLEIRFIEGFTFTFRPMSVWLGLISRVLEWEERKKNYFNVLTFIMTPMLFHTHLQRIID